MRRVLPLLLVLLLAGCSSAASISTMNTEKVIIFPYEYRDDLTPPEFLNQEIVTSFIVGDAEVKVKQVGSLDDDLMEFDIVNRGDEPLQVEIPVVAINGISASVHTDAGRIGAGKTLSAVLHLDSLAAEYSEIDTIRTISGLARSRHIGDEEWESMVFDVDTGAPGEQTYRYDNTGTKVFDDCRGFQIYLLGYDEATDRIIWYIRNGTYEAYHVSASVEVSDSKFPDVAPNSRTAGYMKWTDSFDLLITKWDETEPAYRVPLEVSR